MVIKLLFYKYANIYPHIFLNLKIWTDEKITIYFMPDFFL